MGDFSKPPLDVLQANLAKGYVGLNIEQGVPVLDRDLNLLNDLITATVRAVIARYIGNGVAVGGEGFIITALPADNDFQIGTGPAVPGRCLVGGLEVTIDADLKYGAQPGAPALTTPGPTQPDPREDIVYVDAWLVEVDGQTDPDLLNDDDVGMQTSVRQKPTWAVRVAEGVPVPAPAPGHAHYSLARLTRPRGQAQITSAMIADLRQRIVALSETDRRIQVLERLVLLPVFALSPNQFSPKLGPPGTTVNLFGSNFQVGGARVLFGAEVATLVAPPLPGKLVVTVPDMAAGPVKITVETDGGSVVSDDNFTVLAPPPPADPPAFAASPNQFTPKLGPAGATVTLFGTHFDVGTPRVFFGVVESPSVGVPTPTQVTAQVPAMAAGGVKITIQTDGGSDISDDTFTVL